MSSRPKRKRNQKGSGDGAFGSHEEVVAIDDIISETSEKRPRRHDRNDSSAASKAGTNQQSEPLVNTHPHSQLPSYLSEAFSDLYSQDGLVVMGRGLGWLGLLCSFVRFYSDTTENGYAAAVEEESGRCEVKPAAFGDDGESGQRRRKPPLIFVLNLRDNERQVLLSTLSSWGTPTSELPRIITNEAGQASERAGLYARGGVFVITSRILIVDLLQGTAKPRDIDGMLVAHAERIVGEKSTEAFILRIFRSQRYLMENAIDGSASTDDSKSTSGRGFIKAFTDDASALVSGFAKVDKVLKSLQVQRLYLYPRFHAAVAEELERQPPNVIELRQPLSEKMKEIQNCLAAAMRACLRDLRQKCNLVDLSFLFDASNGKGKRKRDDTDYYGSKGSKGDGQDDWKFSIHQCISTNFSAILTRQLEGDWHRLGRDVKQLITDLKTLSQLFHSLIEYDCCQFWTLLQGIKAMSAASKYPSDWMLQEAGEGLFRVAKGRVYRLVGQPATLKRVLEHKPKEVLLRQVLTEIENRWTAKHKGNPFPTAANVLLMVKDDRALRSVSEHLSYAGKENMAGALKFYNYLAQVVERTMPMLHASGHDVDSLPTEQRLLYQQHSILGNILFYGEDKKEKRDQIHAEDRKKLNDWKKRHRKMVEGKARGAVAADSIRQQAYLDEAIEESKAFADDVVRQLETGDDDDSEGADFDSVSSDDEDELAYKVEPMQGLSLFIRSFSKVAEGEASILLNDTRPDYVVMYDSEPSFIRALEIYSNSMKPNNPGQSNPLAEDDRLQVFFLLYEASAEDINFSKALDREKEAFERLIDHKKRMPTAMPSFNNFSTQEMQQARGGVGGSYAGGALPLSMDTRSGGGKQKASKERRDIAVDVREFRSALPSILHQGGMRLAPVTLTVGDFVLSNVHCVERKSISDLYQSLNPTSGRLYEQMKMMVKHYSVPCLLIEFDSDKSFALQSSNDLGGEVRKSSISSQLIALTTEYPTMRILWSRSAHETLKIFKKLKRNHQEVDVEKAVAIGSNEVLDELLAVGEDGRYNEEEEDSGTNDAAKRMLLRFPGVNAHNARKIMSECDSIAELTKLPRTELIRIAGPQAGQKLFRFFQDRFVE